MLSSQIITHSEELLDFLLALARVQPAGKVRINVNHILVSLVHEVIWRPQLLHPKLAGHFVEALDVLGLLRVVVIAAILQQRIVEEILMVVGVADVGHDVAVIHFCWNLN